MNVFEAFTVEALAALGKPDARERLYTRLDSEGITAHRSWGGGSGGGSGAANGGGAGEQGYVYGNVDALPNWLEARVSKHGVPFYKYAPLREADDPEDDLCEYEKQNQANIEANRRKLDELGLL